MEKKKIYVASSWRNQLQNYIVNDLRSLGHEVYDFKNPPHGRGGFSWDEIDKDWQQWTPQDFADVLQRSEIAAAGFNTDMAGIAWADLCVLVLPCGRSAHTEAGYMKGKGKPVYVVQLDKCEPELMYKIFDGIITSGTQLFSFFKVDKAPAPALFPND